MFYNSVFDECYYQVIEHVGQCVQHFIAARKRCYNITVNNHILTLLLHTNRLKPIYLYITSVRSQFYRAVFYCLTLREIMSRKNHRKTSHGTVSRCVASGGCLWVGGGGDSPSYLDIVDKTALPLGTMRKGEGKKKNENKGEKGEGKKKNENKGEKGEERKIMKI